MLRISRGCAHNRYSRCNFILMLAAMVLAWVLSEMPLLAQSASTVL